MMVLFGLFCRNTQHVVLQYVAKWNIFWHRLVVTYVNMLLQSCIKKTIITFPQWTVYNSQTNKILLIIYALEISMTSSHMHSTLLFRKLTLRSHCQGLTLPALLFPTVDTTYCDVVLIACHETSQFMLCGGYVHKFPIQGLESIGGNLDEVEISTVSTTQCPAYSHIHSTTDISREVNTGEGGDRGGT